MSLAATVRPRNGVVALRAATRKPGSRPSASAISSVRPRRDYAIAESLPALVSGKTATERGASDASARER